MKKVSPLLLVIIFFAFAACTPKAKAPIPVLEYGTMDAVGHKNLLILLRGLGGDNWDFEKHGIIAEVRKRDLPFDIVAPDAHFGYYKTRTIEERLKYDIIDPARRQGYKNIWLAGFSMGGMGGLFYIKFYPDDVDGVILCSPFVGWDDIHEEITAAGGVLEWPGKNDPAEDEWQYLLWNFIKELDAAQEKYPPLFLGYGTDDLLVGDGPKLMKPVLPEKRVFTIPGGHDYQTFRRLWTIHLNRLETRFKKLP